MRALHMLAGAIALTAPILSFLAAFQGALPWALWAGITAACTAAGATMSYFRLRPPPAMPRLYGCCCRDT